MVAPQLAAASWSGGPRGEVPAVGARLPLVADRAARRSARSTGSSSACSTAGTTSRHLGEAAESYPLFLITGIFAWMWASSALSEATNALTGQARLITTMNVPREVFPIGRVTGRFAEYLAGLPILIAIAVVYAAHGGSHLGWSLLALPLAVAVQTDPADRAGAAALLAERADARRRAVHAAGHPGALLRHADHLSAEPGPGRPGMPGWVKIGVRAQPAGRHLPAAPRDLVPGRVPGRPAARRRRSSAACWCWSPAGGSFRRLEPAVLKEL